jgi:hypothetical protein
MLLPTYTDHIYLNLERLTIEEEKVLVKRYCKTIVVAYGKWLGELSGPGFDVPNWVIKWSAATLFRRYYLNHTIADISPKEIMMGCMLLGAKIEESRLVTVDRLYEWRERNYSIQQIVEAESIVADGVMFDIHIFSPTVALSGLFELLASKCTELAATKLGSDTGATLKAKVDLAQKTQKLLEDKKLRAEILKDLETLLFSDAMFIYSPAKLALAATTKGALKEPIKELLGLESETSIAPYFVDSAVSNDELKRLDAKLERVRNPLFNRDSEAYKQKMAQKEQEYIAKQEAKHAQMAQQQQDTLRSLGVAPLPTQPRQQSGSENAMNTTS